MADTATSAIDERSGQGSTAHPGSCWLTVGDLLDLVEQHDVDRGTPVQILDRRDALQPRSVHSIQLRWGHVAGAAPARVVIDLDTDR